jgi:hypothetical protein
MMKTGFQRWVLLGLTLLPLATGCVERRFVITTDPPEAIVEFKGRPLSASPADLQFIYNAKKYEFVAQKEGYEMTVHYEEVKPRWYEYFGVDFISENIIPWTIRDIRHVHIHLKPIEETFVQPDMMLGPANEMRERGKAIEPQPAKGP